MGLVQLAGRLCRVQSSIYVSRSVRVVCAYTYFGDRTAGSSPDHLITSAASRASAGRSVTPLRAPAQRCGQPLPRELRGRGGSPRAGWAAGAARAAGGARSAGFFHTRASRTLREALGPCVRTEGLGLASRATRRSDRRCSDLIFCCSHRRAQGRWTRPTCRPSRARCRS